MSRKITIDFIYDVIVNRLLKSPHNRLFIYPKRGFTRYGTDKFINYVSTETHESDRILDAGAGNKPYYHLFKHVLLYESCDSESVLNETGDLEGEIVDHTFYCDLINIPRSDNYYDKIICSQVLEHVKKPRNVVSELYRVLKPGGKLYITVPSIMGIHLPPHNYFNFLKFGLHEILKDAGFVNIFIEPQGGIFWVLGKVINNTYDIARSNVPHFLKFIFVPFDIFFSIIVFILSFILFHIDFLDKEKDWTLTYNCICSK